MATTPDYTINYDDEKFTKVTNAENDALAEIGETYAGMIADADQFYAGMSESAEKWKNTQTDIQNQQTNFAIQQIEQQKDQLQKDYTKEQAGAYVDWRKQSNQYGVEAEKMASAGLMNTGYSESSQVSMYNTYQNRVATARESFQQAWTSYNNKITEAKLQNNAAIAEIALQAFEKQAEYSLQAFQYKNQLVLDLADKKMETKQFYATQWQNVLDQMNKENALAEEVRQYNETQAWQTEQNQLEREWKTKEAELDREFQSAQAEIERKYKSAEAELDRKHDKDMLEAKTKAEKELAEKEHQLALEKLEKQQEYEMAQLDKDLTNKKALAKYEYDLANSNKSYSYSGSGDNKSYSSSGSSSKKTYAPAKTDKYVGKLYTDPDPVKKGSSGTNTQATMDSILALGYGPLSASKLNQLVASGAVIEYTDSKGVTKFRKAVQTKNTGLKATLPKKQGVNLPTSKFKLK